MKVALLCIGDELLKGATVNTNLAFIGERLLRNGIIPELSLEIPDRRDSILKALDRMRLGDERRLQFELFTGLMRTAYRRDVRALKAWSDRAACLGRERQKELLEYCQRMVRESFAANFRRPEMVCMDEDEERFASRFSPFINEGNVFQVSGLLEEAQGHIERNANPRMVFFDMALRLTVEMKQG